MENIEIWKDINNFEGYYQVSNSGNIRSLDRIITDCFGRKKSNRGKKLSFGSTPTGYLFVGLRKEGFKTQQYCHRLVAHHFIPNPQNKETVNHIDGDKSNNNDWNLEWNTRSENTKHAYDNGLITGGEEGVWSKLNNKQVFEIRKNEKNLMNKDLALIYNVSPSTIGLVINRKTWKHI